MKFSKKVTSFEICFEYVSRFKVRHKKTMRFTQCIEQVDIQLFKNFFFEKCAILRLILNILLFLIVVTSLLHK